MRGQNTLKDTYMRSLSGCGVGVMCEGDFVVVQVRQSDILIKFAERFHEHFHNEDYDVMFTFNR